MADFYYHYKIVGCREEHSTTNTGSKTRTTPFRPAYEFTYTASQDDSTAAFAEFFAALVADAPVNGFPHLKDIDLGGTSAWYLAAFNCWGGVDGDDPTVASEGAWSQKIGKDIYRHECGYSEVSAAAAANLTAKNLS